VPRFESRGLEPGPEWPLGSHAGDLDIPSRPVESARKLDELALGAPKIERVAHQ